MQPPTCALAVDRSPKSSALPPEENKIKSVVLITFAGEGAGPHPPVNTALVLSGRTCSSCLASIKFQN